MNNPQRIMLVGASVGQSWSLGEYARRMNDPAAVVESIAVYQFDKSEALEEILMRPKRKFRLTRTYFKGFFEPSPRLPDTIILKECSAYFPGDLTAYQGLFKSWVKRVRDAHIQVMLATVVPITRERSKKDPGKIEGIMAFNDWVREYAKKENIPVLDLEAALKVSARDRHLRDDLTSGDGSHLNKKAYDLLDPVLQTVLRNKQ